MDWSDLPQKRKLKKRNKRNSKGLPFLAVKANITNITNITNISIYYQLIQIRKHLRRIVLEYFSVHNK
jgi:hypothetical protein